MKTSTRVLVVAAAGVWLLLAGVLLTASRMATGKMMFAGVANHEHERDTTLALSLDGCTTVVLQGMWRAEIVYSARCTVSAVVPVSLAPRVSILGEGGQLICRSPAGRAGDRQITLRIGMPDVAGVEVSGNSSVEIRGFRLDSLRVVAQGMSSITAHDVMVTHFDYAGRGMTQLHMIDKGVVNAAVRVDGMGAVSVHMLGGKLSGRIAGMVQFNQTGEVVSNTLVVEGVETGDEHR